MLQSLHARLTQTCRSWYFLLNGMYLSTLIVMVTAVAIMFKKAEKVGARPTKGLATDPIFSEWWHRAVAGQQAQTLFDITYPLLTGLSALALVMLLVSWPITGNANIRKSVAWTRLACHVATLCATLYTLLAILPKMKTMHPELYNLAADKATHDSTRSAFEAIHATSETLGTLGFFAMLAGCMLSLFALKKSTP